MPRTDQGKAFERWAIELARVLGYRVAHFRPALTKHGWRTAVSADGAGFPDLLLVKPGRVIAAELKSGSGRLTPEQQAWLVTFKAAGVEVYLFRDTERQRFADALQGKPTEQWEPKPPRQRKTTPTPPPLF